MDNTNTALGDEKRGEDTPAIAVNPNPAANGNIQPQLSGMEPAEKAEATDMPNSEITDGESG